ncbi:hypothetical protein E2562_035835 [Oryza meyeriana var. granulata]|uniref:Uncharacterized protein n=1 Tax=Oryza meyeriana var. granulata TaxID=110450 RepID=A0A6G1BQA9_9ORYZ|nr:hypothetical protein E2562_035835 [Oryza meyeriana var. granulata]
MGWLLHALRVWQGSHLLGIKTVVGEVSQPAAIVAVDVCSSVLNTGLLHTTMVLLNRDHPGGMEHSTKAVEVEVEQNEYQRAAQDVVEWSYC